MAGNAHRTEKTANVNRVNAGSPSKALPSLQIVILILFGFNLFLAVYAGWLLTKDQPGLLNYIAQVTGVVAVLLQWIGIFAGTKPKKVPPIDLIRSLSRKRWLQISTPIMTLILFSAIFLRTNPCDQQPVHFDFENGMNDHWEVRWEGQNLLGGQAQADTARACGAGEWSLAFQFDLRDAPFDKAQIKYEADRLKLDQEMSAWVFLPAQAPEDLEISCFILEHNPAGATVEKPEWLWFQTPARRLRSGEWNSVACPAQEFVAAQAGAGSWDHPLLAGFEIRRKSRGGFSGTIYLDKVILK